MKRKRFTEEQIISVLREQKAGAKVADLCRRHGISDATFYNWKAKFGGMEVSDAKRLKALEDENARLKKLLAEQMLDAAALDITEDVGCSPSPRRFRFLTGGWFPKPHVENQSFKRSRRAVFNFFRLRLWGKSAAYASLHSTVAPHAMPSACM